MPKDILHVTELKLQLTLLTVRSLVNFEQLGYILC